MGFLDELQQPDHPRRRDYQQFSKRYDQGRPEDGYDNAEVSRRYQEVASQANPRTMRKAAHSSLSRMQPAQRAQFGQMLQQRAQQQGVQLNYDGQSTDPGVLADLTSQLHQQDPGMLGQLLGAATGSGSGAGTSSGAGGIAGSLLGGGGVASNVVGGLAGDNPIAQAALAGITSYAAKNMMGG